MRSAKAAARAAILLALAAAPARTEIRVSPTGVNVNAQGATSAFLTYGGLAGWVPMEAFWCGELIAATPDAEETCDPNTLCGTLPLRYDVSQASDSTFTEVMSIPPSVARRAYQAAETGAASDFFYVRRFRSLSGLPDEYVVVSCRLTGGGARVPLSLVEVTIRPDVEAPVLFLRSGETFPAIHADITYTGTGRLAGRWEVVLPGEDPPAADDLLPEAARPLGVRGLERRYAELERFNLFLGPTGRATLRGPAPARIPTSVEGTYLILLRIEATDEREGDSELDQGGAGPSLVHGGGVAGFPMPTLRYVVGSGGSEHAARRVRPRLALLAPADSAVAALGAALEFRWTEAGTALFYRVEIEDAGGQEVVAAVVRRDTRSWQAPPWLGERAGERPLRWRVSGVDVRGTAVERSPWRTLRFAAQGATSGPR